MDIALEYNGDIVVAKDEQGNEIRYRKVGNYLKELFASFQDVIYDKTELGWKRSKRGAVSKAFYGWYEEFDKAVYQKHYKKA